MTIYKSFIRSHFVYDDAVYDRASNKSLHQNPESLQYSTAIAITVAIRRTSSEMLFQELGLETLKSTRWLRKLCLFYKLMKEKSPAYFSQQIPENNTSYTTKRVQKVKSLFSRQKQTFSNIISFPQLQWNGIRLMLIFVTRLLKFIRSEPNQMFNVDCSKELKFLSRIRLGLSHLPDHKFRHNFQDCINPISSCVQEIETSTHFLLHCCDYHFARQTLFKKSNKIDSTTLK